MRSDHDTLQRVFRHAFSVDDVAGPLLSFDAAASAAVVREILESQRQETAGVRFDGVITAEVTAEDLAVGACGDFARPIEEASVVPASLPLASLVERLDERPRMFVSVFGQVGGIVRRTDLLRPPARMWLFGMITLLELRFDRMIERFCPGEAWKESLSEGRLRKAEELQEERARRGRRPSLSDCLQFSDKAHIIARREPLRAVTRFGSRRQAEEAGKRLELLRNDLAHSQDIVADDWDTIVLLARELESVVAGPPGLE